MSFETLLPLITTTNFKAVARAISLVENEVEGYMSFLQKLPANSSTKIIGITGPPGAGKSTLVDALIATLIANHKTVAVLCVDPSSPFNLGAILGDRVRMASWHSNPQVYIRSLATRGSLGGLHPKIIEITDILCAAQFDYILVETVGVGQSEIEVVGLADTTVVVLVPEGGDAIQTMKAGLMEIADIFVVNKADRPEADKYLLNLQQMLAPVYSNATWQVPILKTEALNNKGITELVTQIELHLQQPTTKTKKAWLLTQKAMQLITKHYTAHINQAALLKNITAAMAQPSFNLYTFVSTFIKA